MYFTNFTNSTNYSRSTSIRFSGFGGQGIILSAVVLGDALVIQRGLYAAQTQSYGSEARGGQCQSELMVSEAPILTPIRAANDILVAMFQTALDTYIGSLRKGGTLFVDSGLVTDLSRVPPETPCYKIPATETAIALGNKMIANMVMLGCFAAGTGMATPEQLDAALAENVKENLLDLNKKAIRSGFEIWNASFACGVGLEIGTALEFGIGLESGTGLEFGGPR